MLFRIRRMAWALAGSQFLGDAILTDAIRAGQSDPLLGPSTDPFENLFQWSFTTLDAACSMAGVVRRLGTRPPTGDLAGRFLMLPYELRVSAALILIEALPLGQAAAISGRTAYNLANGAEAAAQILEAH